MKKLHEGRVPGFEYVVAMGKCAVCHSEDVPVMRTDALLAICEACSNMMGWLWRRFDDETLGLPGATYNTKVGFASVLIVRDRKDDYVVPFDVLLVARKDEDSFGLPGGKVERSESPSDTAVRELFEETGFRTFAPALESLYIGYSPRGRLGQVFLCRAYVEPAAGSREPGDQSFSWKPWPIVEHVGFLKGFYEGVNDAFWARRKLQVQADASTPLSLRLSTTAEAYLDLRMGKEKRYQEHEAQLSEAFLSVMGAEEKAIVDVIVGRDEKQKGELLVKKSEDSLQPTANSQQQTPDEDVAKAKFYPSTHSALIFQAAAAAGLSVEAYIALKRREQNSDGPFSLDEYSAPDSELHASRSPDNDDLTVSANEVTMWSEEKVEPGEKGVVRPPNSILRPPR